MERNVIIAIVLSLGVLFLYPYLLKQIYPEQSAKQDTAIQEPLKTVDQTAVAAPEKAGAANEKPAERAQVRVSETVVNVETPLYRAELTNVGGAIKSWKLKKYRETKEKGSLPIDLVFASAGETTNRTALSIDNVSRDIVFDPVTRPVVIQGDEKAEVVFTGTTMEGLKVVKKYTFTAWNYTTETELTIQNLTGRPFNGRIETILASGFMPHDKQSAQYHRGPLGQTHKDLLRQDADEARESGSGTVRWIGVEDKYFLKVLIPAADKPISWVTEIPSETASRAAVRVEMPLAPAETGSYGYLAFFGPKEYDLLSAHNAGLGEAIEFGCFSFMAKPMLAVLNLFQHYVVNYS